MDIPFVGMGCGKEEMGYIYGQYKRIKPTGNFMFNSDMLQVSSCIYLFIRFVLSL
jgi:hypothetical protein